MCGFTELMFAFSNIVNEKKNRAFICDINIIKMLSQMMEIYSVKINIIVVGEMFGNREKRFFSSEIR